MSTLRVNTIQDTAGSGSPAINGLARAWVNFNGTGTVAINASLNVSSITDDGVGLYTINYATALPNALISGACSTAFAAGNNGAIDSVAQIYDATTTTARVVFGLTNGTKRDHAYNMVVIFR